MFGDWVPEERLQVFLRAVFQFAGYSFDDMDWRAITTQLDPTAQESVTLATYDVAGISVKLEADHDGGVVSFQIAPPAEIEQRIIGAHAAIQLLDDPPLS